jgi:hypothetical protein
MLLGHKLEKANEKGEASAEQDSKERSIELMEGSSRASMNIWCFGPQNTGANQLLDLTKGVQHMGEIEDHMCNSFPGTARSSRRNCGDYA